MYKKFQITKVKGPIRIFETFAGIGAQHKAIKNIDKEGKNFKVLKTSEWDARAIIAYAQIHHKKDFNIELNKIKKWNNEKIFHFLKDKTFSLNSKNPGNIFRKNRDFQNILIASCLVNNNLPDITNVSGNEIKNIDLLTYSFPCQGLSIANMGRDKGININSTSTSNLIWEIRRILLEALNNNIKLPKFLLMENVKNLLSKKHINDYKNWLSFLKDLGYTTKTMVLNGLDHSSLQKRERVFAISVMDWDNDLNDWEFEEKFKNKYKRILSKKDRKEKYFKILTSSINLTDELFDAIPNKTKSRIKMQENNHDLFDRKWLKNKEYIFNTLTTKQDRHPNLGMIKIPNSLKIKNKLDSRFITPREAYLIMGFSNKDFNSVKKMYKNNVLTKSSLYRQAGNSIIVNILEDIFKYIKEVNNE